MDNYKQLIIIKGEPKDDIIRCYYDKVKKKQAVVSTITILHITIVTTMLNGWIV